MNKFQNFTIDELAKIFTYSSTFSEIQKKCGYSTSHSSRNRIIQNIADENNIILFSKSLKKQDLTGQVFNYLTVLSLNIELSKEKKQKIWNCICLCGKECVASSNALLNNHKKSCGCLKNKKRDDAPNLLNQTFTFLTVIEQLPNDEHRNIIWKCRCKCGNETTASSHQLLSKEKISCGCYQSSWEGRVSRIKDKTNNIYGFLKPLEINKEATEKNKKTTWKCLCTNCNSIINVTASNLEKGQLSCGCIRSIGEKVISKLLKENNLDYKKEITFPDLFGEKKLLRFDFGIYEKNKLLLLIEYNGIQHYQAVSFFGGEEQLKKQQYYDSLKQEYCKTKNIPLIVFSSLDEINIDKIRGVINE